MKSLLELWKCLLDESGRRCGTSTIRDYKYVTDRVEHEGISFLTISLAEYSKSLQKALDLSYVADDLFLSFRKGKGGLPLFLGGFLQRVFDPTSGRLLDTPCLDSLYCLQQLTKLFSKVEIECTPRRTRKAMDKFVECEQDVRQNDDVQLLSKSNDLGNFARIGRLLWAGLFANVDSRIYNDGVLPWHSSGATADKLRGNAKYNQTVWTSRLEEVFPFWENLFPSQSSSVTEGLGDVDILEPGAEIPVKVIPVPKTLKTPRIIAIEPTCMQYMQQGILEMIVDEVARSNYVRDFIGTESQEPNKRLARKGSITGALATLDLSEASDRVSNQHVRLLLANHPHLLAAVDATRSRKADVPGHGVLRLAKFASMGSALCFPFEAIVFTTVVFLGIEKVLNRPLTRKDIKSFSGRVRVYGDDIIVPVRFVHSVVEALEAFGFRVNTNKSFWTGKFRESCGGEYYSGADISSVKLKHVPPTTRRDVDALISYVEFRNLLAERGWCEIVEVIDAQIERLIPFPFVEPTSRILGKHGDWRNANLHHDDDLHHPLVKGMMIVAEPPSSPLGESGALMKYFLHSEREIVLENKRHLDIAGRPRSVRITTGMARPY